DSVAVLPRELDDLLHDVLARVVLRMRLAGDDDLHRQRKQALEIAEHEPGTLVRREAPRESDRQPLRVEVRELGEPCFGAGVSTPQLGTVDVEDVSPRLLVGRRGGIDSVVAQQRGERRLEPGAEGDAVPHLPPLPVPLPTAPAGPSAWSSETPFA